MSVVGTFDERAGEGGQVCGERQVRQRGAQRQHVHGGGRAVQRVRRPHHHHVARRDAALRHTHTAFMTVFFLPLHRCYKNEHLLAFVPYFFTLTVKKQQTDMLIPSNIYVLTI